MAAATVAGVAGEATEAKVPRVEAASTRPVAQEARGAANLAAEGWVGAAEGLAVRAAAAASSHQGARGEGGGLVPRAAGVAAAAKETVAETLAVAVRVAAGAVGQWS